MSPNQSDSPPKSTARPLMIQWASEDRIMMNTVVGSAIGGLVAGAVALGAAAAMKPSPAPAYAPDPNGAYAMPVANTGALNNGSSLGNGLQCQPYEEAVLRRALV